MLTRKQQVWNLLVKNQITEIHYRRQSSFGDYFDSMIDRSIMLVEFPPKKRWSDMNLAEITIYKTREKVDVRWDLIQARKDALKYALLSLIIPIAPITTFFFIRSINSMRSNFLRLNLINADIEKFKDINLKTQKKMDENVAKIKESLI